MGSVNREAYVERGQEEAWGKRLDETIRDRGVLLVTGPVGAGKKRFFDRWWQGGPSGDSNTEGHMSNTDDVLLVELERAPAKSVPMSCVLATKLWMALLELERARGHGVPPRRPERVRRWYTEDHALSLIHEHILPLLHELAIQAVVLTNGHLLDKAALALALNLRTHSQLGRPHIPQRALIICCTIDAELGNEKRLTDMMNDAQFPQMRVAWAHKELIKLMDEVEFTHVMVKLITVNLQADLGDDLDANAVISTFGELTRCNWHYMVELVQMLDQALGASNGTRRVLNQAVVDRVVKRWGNPKL